VRPQADGHYGFSFLGSDVADGGPKGLAASLLLTASVVFTSAARSLRAIWLLRSFSTAFAQAEVLTAAARSFERHLTAAQVLDCV
jgi:hypothetical protein